MRPLLKDLSISTSFGCGTRAAEVARQGRQLEIFDVTVFRLCYPVLIACNESQNCVAVCHQFTGNDIAIISSVASPRYD